LTALARTCASWRASLIAGALAGGCTLALVVAVAPGPSAPGSAAAVRAMRDPGLSLLPASALGVVSATLGASDPAYRVGSGADGSLTASNPAQALRARFSAGGVTVSSGTMAVGLHLSAVGYGARLRSVAAVSPRASSNRADYARPGLQEWYANGPAGLEQGFTLEREPVGRHTGPLTLAIALSGVERASVDGHDTGLTLLGRGGSTLLYRGLIATDARGRRLPAGLALRGGRLLVRVEATGARYPLTIDPFVQQAKLTGGGEEGKGQFGISVSLSADGSTALVGAVSDESEVSKKEEPLGAAWVFTRNGSTWTQQGPKLTAKAGEEEVDGRFGKSVNLSADGSTALIGAPFDAGFAGSAWVFTRSGSTWTQQGPKLTGGGEEVGEGRFGTGVSLSASGDTALVGGEGDNGVAGAAWVFTRSGSTWTQQGPKLTGGKEEVGEGRLGESVALSGDGNTALVGGYGDNGGIGAAWVFTRSGSTWTQQGPKLKAASGEEVGDGAFAFSVALSGEGNTALVGSPGDKGGFGAAYVFTRSGSSWTQQGTKLTGSETTSESEFGTGAALSETGETALVGGEGDSAGAGAAWVFARSGSTWSEQGSKLTGGGEEGGGLLGQSVALSADGDTAIAGGEGDDTSRGAAWAFGDPPAGAITGSASSIGLSGATVEGTIGAGPSSTTYFQYGTSTAYGSSTSPTKNGVRSASLALTGALTGLSPGTTYHYRLVSENSAGTSFGADATFTTTVLPEIPPLPARAPLIERVSQSHASWREGRRFASLARRGAPTGTLFSIALSEEAKLTLTFTQRVGGRRVHGRCVAQSRRNRHRRSCLRTVVRGAQSFKAHGGLDNVEFQGVFPHAPRLTPGRYTVVFTATSGGLRSNSRSLSFTIVG
jgi:FG-GAP repeat